MKRPVIRVRRPALRRGLAPLRQRGFAYLLAGQSVSNIGDFFYAVALPWYVLASHGGVVLLGTVLAAYGIPRTALLVIGGHASDRWRPWTVMLAADCVRACAVGALIVVAALGPARAIVLVPISAVFGAASAFFVPAVFANCPALLPAEDLQAGNALLTAGMQISALAGPAAGGAVVAVLGPSPAFAVDAASFVVSVLTLVGVRRAMRSRHDARSSPATAARVADPSGRRPTLRAILRSERIAQVMLLVLIAANLGSGGVDEVGLPSLARGTLHAGARGYGILLAAVAGGALVGTLAAAQARQPRRPFVAGSIALLSAAPFLAAVPFLVNTFAAAAALAAFGSLNSFANIVAITAFQKWADPDILGRLMGGLALASFGIFPVAAIVAAFLVRYLGTASLFLFAAAMLALAVLAGLSQRTWREFGARHPAVDMTAAETAQHHA
jgi:predicted MFS family arabinose efflux permease